MSEPGTRIGGHLVVECLTAAGAQAIFGVPGIHALAIWDGLVDSSLRYIGMRTELSAGFAADGYARAGGRPAVLLTTTGWSTRGSPTKVPPSAGAGSASAAGAASPRSSGWCSSPLWG